MKKHRYVLKKNMMSLCKKKYLKLPQRKLLHVRDYDGMMQREIIYKKRNEQLKAVCEKYKEIGIFQDTCKFTPHPDPFLFDVKNHLAWCRIPKVNIRVLNFGILLY